MTATCILSWVSRTSYMHADRYNKKYLANKIFWFDLIETFLICLHEIVIRFKTLLFNVSSSVKQYLLEKNPEE